VITIAKGDQKESDTIVLKMKDLPDTDNLEVLLRFYNEVAWKHNKKLIIEDLPV